MSGADCGVALERRLAAGSAFAEAEHGINGLASRGVLSVSGRRRPEGERA